MAVGFPEPVHERRNPLWDGLVLFMVFACHVAFDWAKVAPGRQRE